MESLNSKILSLFREQISKSIGMQVKRFTVTVEVNGKFYEFTDSNELSLVTVIKALKNESRQNLIAE